jgi:hypothetical protein
MTDPIRVLRSVDDPHKFYAVDDATVIYGRLVGDTVVNDVLGTTTPVEIVTRRPERQAFEPTTLVD